LKKTTTYEEGIIGFLGLVFGLNFENHKYIYPITTNSSACGWCAVCASVFFRRKIKENSHYTPITCA
jgi:hypothetical protein